MSAALRAAAAAGAAASLVACSASPSRSEPRDVAVRFVSAVLAKDGATACTLLTKDAQSAAVGATNAKCETAVTNLDEKGTQVRGIQLWGDAAQVRVGTDVIFLRQYDTGWKVRAAGCKKMPHQPYDCDVDG